MPAARQSTRSSCCRSMETLSRQGLRGAVSWTTASMSSASRCWRSTRRRNSSPIADADLGLETEDEKEEIKKQSEDNKELLDCAEQGAGRQGQEGRADRPPQEPSVLPACRRPGNARDGEGAQPAGSRQRRRRRVHAERVLELNAEHPIFKKLCALQAEGSDKLADLRGYPVHAGAADRGSAGGRSGGLRQRSMRPARKVSSCYACKAGSAFYDKGGDAL